MEKILIAVFEDHKKAGEALGSIEKQGLDMKKVSVIGKDHYSKNGAAAKFSPDEKPGFAGGFFWNSLPFDKGSYSVPGGGTFGVLGPLAGVVERVRGEDASEEKFSFVNKALLEIGVPKDKIRKYQDILSEEKDLLIVHGAADKLEMCRETLEKAGASEVVEYVV